MTELLVILVVGLLVLGPKRLPELARSLGRGLAEFRRASTDMRREFLDVQDEMRIDRVEEEAATERSAPADGPGSAELAAAGGGATPERDTTSRKTDAAAGSLDATSDEVTENTGG